MEETKTYSENPLVQLLVDNNGNYKFRKEVLIKKESDLVGNDILIVKEVYLEN